MKAGDYEEEEEEAVAEQDFKPEEERISEHELPVDAVSSDPE